MLFGDTRTPTNVIEHDIDVGDTQQQFYRCSADKYRVMEAEITHMLDHQIVVPSSSSWALARLLVAKLDGSLWFCNDYRRVNKADSYPLPQM